MTHRFAACRPGLVTLAAATLLASQAHATDIARGALLANSQVKPNVVFGIDNSGSMDYEILISGTSDGGLWWNTDPGVMSAWTASGAPQFGGVPVPKFTYLFPNGCSRPEGRRGQCDSRLTATTGSQYALMPTAEMAAMRSSDFNGLYYDPSRTYLPWAPATLGGTLRSFDDADPAAAPSDPLRPATLRLDAEIALSTASNHVFQAVSGMTVPAGASRFDAATDSWLPVPAPFRVPAGAAYPVAMRYFPATYWNRAPCTPNGVDCATAPDRTTLQRHEIRPGAVFPSGRDYAHELANFANWFTYYRKRRLMLSASMGQVLPTLSGMRLGVTNFTDTSNIAMVDADSSDPLANGRVVTGAIYDDSSSAPTATAKLLLRIGRQFQTRRDIVQASCQRNAAVIVTDGFATPTPNTLPPAYDARTWGASPPYATTSPGTIADIALSFYTNNLRPDLPAGHVRAAPADDPNPAADRNRDLHLNTYAITLGAQGLVWPGRTDPYRGGPIAWQVPEDSHSPSSIDDLWHATINGRGTMLSATTPDETAASMQAVLADILKPQGAQGAVTFGNPTLSAEDAVAYVGSYRPKDWSGDVVALAVQTASGAIGGAPRWSADTALTRAGAAGRRIFTHDGTRGTSFTAATIGSRVDPGDAYGPAADVVAYLRGDRSKEGETYRPRSGLMGAAINADPVVDRVRGIVYATTAEGMVHALDKVDGRELWAYVPGFTHGDLGATTQRSWTFRTLLDATPTLAEAGPRRILVGGAGSGGAGYYALDVTPNAAAPSAVETETELAGRVLWEFPNATSASTLSTPSQVRDEVGVSLGKPVVVRTVRFGWVVLVTSGYNSRFDGRGRLFVLDAATGAIRLELPTTGGASAAVDAGLAQVSAAVEPDGTSRHVYGGDLLGNLWHFDLESGSVMKLAALVDAAGRPLPVTAAPELGRADRRRMVYIGTGRMLGTSDLDDGGTNAFFAIRDDGTPVDDIRRQSAPRTLSFDGALRHLVGNAVDWATQRGWYVDLPPGEKAASDPSLAFGVIAWTTNTPSLENCASTSTLYVADAAAGLELPPNRFLAEPFSGTVLGSSLASRVTLARLPGGSLLAATQQSDATTTSHALKVPNPVAPRKSAWRELRQ